MAGRFFYGKVVFLILLIAATASPVRSGVPIIDPDLLKEIEFDSDAKPLEVALVRAAFKNDLPEVKRIVEAHPEIVNAHPETLFKGLSSHYNEWTALHWAVVRNNHEMAELLLKHGADHHRKADTVPILSRVQDAQMAKVLIDAGADVNAGQPLRRIWNGGAVRVLLEKGAKVDALEDRLNETALLTSATYDNLDAVKVLVEYKANVNVRNIKGETPLQNASRTGDLALVKLLVDHGADVLTTDHEGNTPIQYAAGGWGWKNQSADIVKLLLQHGASLKQKTTSGETLLHLAARSHLVETAKYLLDAGLDVNAELKYGATPLHYAVKYCCDDTDTEMVKLLIQRGANVNAKTLDTVEDHTENATAYVQKIMTPLDYTSIVAHVRPLQTGGIPGVYEGEQERVKRTNRTRKAIADLLRKLGPNEDVKGKKGVKVRRV